MYPERTAHETAIRAVERIDRIIVAVDHRWPQHQPALDRVYTGFLSLWVAVERLLDDLHYIASPVPYLIISLVIQYWYVTLLAYCRRNCPALYVITVAALLWPVFGFYWYALYTLALRH